MQKILKKTWDHVCYYTSYHLSWIRILVVGFSFTFQNCLHRAPYKKPGSFFFLWQSYLICCVNDTYCMLTIFTYTPQHNSLQVISYTHLQVAFCGTCECNNYPPGIIQWTKRYFCLYQQSQNQKQDKKWQKKI